MVAMGRALMMEPSVLLLDEPSAGLSPALQDEVFVQTREINKAGVSGGHGRAERRALPADLRPGLRARPGPQRLHRPRAASSRPTPRSSSSTSARWPSPTEPVAARSTRTSPTPGSRPGTRASVRPWVGASAPGQPRRSIPCRGAARTAAARRAAVLVRLTGSPGPPQPCRPVHDPGRVGTSLRRTRRVGATSCRLDLNLWTDPRSHHGQGPLRHPLRHTTRRSSGRGPLTGLRPTTAARGRSRAPGAEAPGALLVVLVQREIRNPDPRRPG